jgi:RNA polymerase sigma factor (sigma-70 family)
MRSMSHRGTRRVVTAGSFAAFYDREWRQVVGLGFVLTGSRAQAEDFAQDAFIAAFRDWHRVAGMDSPGGWVRRVVVNRSSSWFRRLSAERRALRRLGDPQPPGDLDLDAQAAEVWAEVRALPRRQRQAVALVYFDGLSTAEAADVMGCGVETARTHLKRGRTALARRLGVWEGPDA